MSRQGDMTRRLQDESLVAGRDLLPHAGAHDVCPKCGYGDSQPIPTCTLDTNLVPPRTNSGILEETLKPRIIPDSPGIPGGDAETRDNPGKPSILGRHASFTYAFGARRTAADVYTLCDSSDQHVLD